MTVIVLKTCNKLDDVLNRYCLTVKKGINLCFKPVELFSGFFFNNTIYQTIIYFKWLPNVDFDVPVLTPVVMTSAAGEVDIGSSEISVSHHT